MKSLAIIVSTRILYEGWLRLSELEMRWPDGTVSYRQVEEHGDAVAVLPFDPVRRTLLLIRQPRPAVIHAGEADDIFEPIAGILDDVSPEVGARREALEEAGIALGALEPLFRLWSLPGISTERMSYFLAPYRPTDRVSSGGGLASEQEHITVTEVSAGEAWSGLISGRLTDAKLVILLLALRDRHPDLFYGPMTRPRALGREEDEMPDTPSMLPADDVVPREETDPDQQEAADQERAVEDEMLGLE